jgi:hypothetical protein
MACPWVAFVGALCLPLISLAMLALNAAVEKRRPPERVELNAGLNKLGFFARTSSPEKSPGSQSAEEHPSLLANVQL